jgi:hypothetical protein
MIEKIKEVFTLHSIAWVEPYLTTEGSINRKEAGRHRGLYYIYPEVNFYFGKAATNTVYARHATHRPKLDVDLATLYGAPVEKKQPKWSFPRGWKEAVRKFIIEDSGPIPDHFEVVEKGKVIPGVLAHPVVFKVNVDTLPVLVWDLDHLGKKEISKLEEDIIKVLMPYANAESYRARNSA